MALVDYRTKDGLGIIEINNPPANVYTLDSLKLLDAAILKARFDSDVHVIVIVGAGDKFFCAGADIQMLSSESSEFKNNFALFGHETLVRLENTPKLVIAGVGLAEVNLGVIPGMGGTQRLPRIVGRARALELGATGRMIAFEEAQAWNLIHEIFNSEGFNQELMDYAGQFVAPNKPSKAVGLIKRAIQSGMNGSLSEGLALEREALAQAFDSVDAAEGLNAYQEKRVAKFVGK